MKFTRIPESAFKELVLNAGYLATTFDPAAGTAPEESALLGATTGGINFTAVQSFIDFGEDIDNCPKNMKELKQIESWEVKCSGTYVSASPANVKSMLGAAEETTTSKVSKITPRNDLKDSDFTDLWLLCDYSDKHGTTNGGFCAIHMLNTLSTGGFSLQTGDKEKGKMSFEYTAHYSITAQDTVPCEVYIKAGEDEA